jgi:hypothetical protein
MKGIKSFISKTFDKKAEDQSHGNKPADESGSVEYPQYQPEYPQYQPEAPQDGRVVSENTRYNHNQPTPPIGAGPNQAGQPGNVEYYQYDYNEEPFEMKMDEEEESGFGNTNECCSFMRTSPEYDHLWNHKNSFKEEVFHKNFTAPRKWIDSFYGVIYWINLIITVVLFFLAKSPTKDPIEGNNSMSKDDIVFVGVISIIISLVIVILNILFVRFYPEKYVRFAAIINLVLCVLFIIPVSAYISLYFIIFAAVVAVTILLQSIFKCRQLKFTACVMKSSTVILKKYPSLIVFNLVMFLIQSLFSYLFSTGAIMIWANKYSPGLYVYLVFSYYFITRTLSYFTYSVCAGVATAWYFLNGSEYEIKQPFLRAFKNSIGPNFGTCALAGFIESITKVIEFLNEQKNLSPSNIVKCCIAVCCCCILCTLRCLLNVFSKFSLIYCAMFGVPAKEGARRWLRTKKITLVKQVIRSTIITTTFDFYRKCGSVIGSSVGALIAVFYFAKDSPHVVFMATMGAFFAFAGVFMISQPIIVLADTLFIGFGEAPHRLKTGAKEVYDLFDDDSKMLMEEEIARPKDEKERCCVIF